MAVRSVELCSVELRAIAHRVWARTVASTDSADRARANNVSPAIAARIVERNDRFYLVLLDRSDSPHWQRDARDNAVYLQALAPKPRAVLDVQVTPTERLRIFEVSEVRAGL